MLQDHKDESLQQGRWKIVSLIDFILSKIHQATAHVFSESGFVCGNARDEQRNSQVYFEMGRSSTTWRDDDVESNQFEVLRLRECHVNPWATVVKFLGAAKEHVSSTNDSIGKERTPETYAYPHHVHGHHERASRLRTSFIEVTNQTSGTPKASELMQDVRGRPRFRKHLENRRVGKEHGGQRKKVSRRFKCACPPSTLLFEGKSRFSVLLCEYDGGRMRSA